MSTLLRKAIPSHRATAETPGLNTNGVETISLNTHGKDTRGKSGYPTAVFTDREGTAAGKGAKSVMERLARVDSFLALRECDRKSRKQQN